MWCGHGWKCSAGRKAQLSPATRELRALDSGAFLARGPTSATSVTCPFTKFKQGRKHWELYCGYHVESGDYEKKITTPPFAAVTFIEWLDG